MNSALVSSDQAEIASPVLQTPQKFSHIWPSCVRHVIKSRVNLIIIMTGVN